MARFQAGDRVQSIYDTGPAENPRFCGVVSDCAYFKGGETPYYHVRTEGGPHDGFLYVGLDETLEPLE